MPEFDLKTQRYNKKGQVISEAPYIMYIEDGKQIFERPPHSGQFYYIDGSEVEESEQPQNTHSNQVAAKESKRAKASPEQLRSLNKKLKAHGKQAEGQSGGIMDQPKLDAAEEEALNSLIDDEEQISATQPKEKTNAEAQKKA